MNESVFDALGAPVGGTTSRWPWTERARLSTGPRASSGREGSDRNGSRQPLQLLLVEDDPDHAILVQRLLERGMPGTTVRWASNLAEACDGEVPDLVLADLGLPDASGSKTVDGLLNAWPSCPLVVLTTDEQERTAIETLRAGAQDFLAKPDVTADGLRRAILFALQRQQQQLRLENLAHFDTMTGALKREPFRDEVERALHRLERHGGSIALMFIDIDHFKQVNDTLGHEVGDRLLVEVAARLRSGVRDSDLVGRMGGDEFAVLLWQPEHSELQVIAERVLSSLRETMHVEGYEIQVSGSVGIAMPETPSDGVSELFQRADQAMYVAKSEGRDGYRFYSAYDTPARIGQSPVTAPPRRVVSADEFSLHFQVIRSLESQEPIGCEARVRLRRPDQSGDAERDLLTDGRFGERVHRQVVGRICAQVAGLPLASRLPVSFDVSPDQFMAPGFAEGLETTLGKHGLSGADIRIEVLELALAEDEQRTRTVLSRLWNLGVEVTIDRFGVSPTSLTHLRDPAVTAIKVDHRYVSGNSARRVDERMVGTLVQLGAALDCKVIADGVEHKEQLATLLRLGVDAWQGPLGGEPTCWPRVRGNLPRR